MSQAARVLGNLGSVTLLVLAVAGLAIATEPDGKEVRKTVPLSAGASLAIDTYKGSVTVTTWDKADAEIYARIEPDGSSAGQEQAVAETEVRIEGSGAAVRVRSDYGKLRGRSWHDTIFNWGDGESLPLVRYEIRMPRNAKLRIKDYKSEIKVDGLRADLDIDTYKGSTVISSFEGALKLETYKGDARVRFENVAGPSSVDTYKGEIEIAVAPGRGFNLASDLGRRGTLDMDRRMSLSSPTTGARRDRYQGTVNGGGAELRLKTYKGSFRLRS